MLRRWWSLAQETEKGHDDLAVLLELIPSHAGKSLENHWKMLPFLLGPCIGKEGKPTGSPITI